MTTKNKIRIEDSEGNIYYPHTESDVVIMSDGQTLEDKFKNGWLEYKDVTNLSATTAGVITWGLPLATDQTRTAIMLCRANKDISNMDYASCLADSSVTKNTLGKDSVTNTYTGLVNNTRYWVKCFIEYTIGGKKYYSNGVTVTFTTPDITITEFYNSGNEFTAITGGWKNGFMGGSGTVTKTELNIVVNAPSGSAATVMTTNLINFVPIKTLKFEAEFSQSGDGQAILGLTNESSGIGQGPEGRFTTSASRQILSVDVSNVNKNMYIAIYLNSPIGSTGSLILHRVWGES